MSQACLHEHSEGVVIHLRVTPRASQSKIHGVVGDELKVSLHAPPADGQANAELIALLSKTLNIARSNIEIIRGETGRNKSVLIRGGRMEQVRHSLHIQS
ncbi:MAG: YggU family protein [bacterium]|nr:YggU family protein [bacterium]